MTLNGVLIKSAATRYVDCALYYFFKGHIVIVGVLGVMKISKNDIYTKRISIIRAFFIWHPSCIRAIKEGGEIHKNVVFGHLYSIKHKKYLVKNEGKNHWNTLLNTIQSVISFLLYFQAIRICAHGRNLTASIHHQLLLTYCCRSK